MTVLATEAAPVSVRKASFSRETLRPSVMGRIRLPRMITLA